jgi:hypothetical protein
VTDSIDRPESIQRDRNKNGANFSLAIQIAQGFRRIETKMAASQDAAIEIKGFLAAA